jgi:hypothetical protein
VVRVPAELPPVRRSVSDEDHRLLAVTPPHIVKRKPKRPNPILGAITATRCMDTRKETHKNIDVGREIADLVDITA